MYVEISQLLFKVTYSTNLQTRENINMVMFDMCGTEGKREMTYSTCSQINMFWGSYIVYYEWSS